MTLAEIEVEVGLLENVLEFESSPVPDLELLAPSTAFFVALKFAVCLLEEDSEVKSLIAGVLERFIGQNIDVLLIQSHLIPLK